jgi:hypothetical protein
MASAAIAAGVLELGPAAVQVVPSATSSVSPASRASAYLPTSRVLAPLGGGWPTTTTEADASVASHTWVSGSVAVDAPASNGANTQRAMSSVPHAMVHRAPLDRVVVPESVAIPVSHAPAAAGGKPPDLEQLTDEIYDRLRWRLVAERERNLNRR